MDGSQLTFSVMRRISRNMSEDNAESTAEAMQQLTDEQTIAAVDMRLGRMNQPIKETILIHRQEFEELVDQLQGILPLAGIVGSEPLRDVWLVRFLVAAKFKVPEANEKFRAMVAFRERHGLDAIRKQFEDGSLTPSNIPGFEEHFACCPDTFHLCSGDAKDGSPIAIASVPRWDYEKYYSLDADLEDKFQIYHMEYMVWRLDKLSLESGNLRGNVKLLDLNGVTLSQRGEMKRNSQHRKTRYERLGANLEECYPEMMSRIVICNAPSFAAMLWWVAKGFLPQRVIDKVCIVTAAGTAAALLEVIDTSVLPINFGGDSDARWEMGNTVRE